MKKEEEEATFYEGREREENSHERKRFVNFHVSRQLLSMIEGSTEVTLTRHTTNFRRVEEFDGTCSNGTKQYFRSVHKDPK